MASASSAYFTVQHTYETRTKAAFKLVYGTNGPNGKLGTTGRIHNGAVHLCRQNKYVLDTATKKALTDAKDHCVEAKKLSGSLELEDNFLLATAYFYLGQYQEAYNTIKLIDVPNDLGGFNETKNTKFSDILNRRGEILYRLGRVEEARKDFLFAARIEKRNTWPFYNCAVYYRDKGQIIVANNFLNHLMNADAKTAKRLFDNDRRLTLADRANWMAEQGVILEAIKARKDAKASASLLTTSVQEILEADAREEIAAKVEAASAAAAAAAAAASDAKAKKTLGKRKHEDFNRPSAAASGSGSAAALTPLTGDSFKLFSPPLAPAGSTPLSLTPIGSIKSEEAAAKEDSQATQPLSPKCG